MPGTKKLGWRIKISKYTITGYHFFVFLIMWPLLLSLPLVIYGWNAKLFGILVSAYLSGMILEDFMWYVVNPVVKVKELFYRDFADYYPRVKIGNIKIPLGYFLGMGIALLSWYFLWR